MNNATKYIAIADDHSLFRKGLAGLINYFPNYKVLFEAANGKDFINQLRPRALPDIALLDISMPEMDGYATAKYLRVNYPEIRVLALSTMDSETAIINMIKCGATGYILKDAEPAELKQAFDDVLNKGYFYNDLVTNKVMQQVNALTDNNNPFNPVKLTETETAFLKLLCTEKTYKEIAADMHVSARTVDGYRDALFEKLNIKTRTGLVLYTIKNGIVKI